MVNAVDSDNSTTIGSPEDLMLATPGDGATLDLGLTYPLVGDWTFSALPGANVLMAPFSQTVLIRAALAIPEPSSLVLGLRGLLAVAGRRKK